MAFSVGAFTRVSLKQLVQEVAERTRNTGHYAGLVELELRDKNPFRWEEAMTKLIASAVTAREVAVHIAASPLTRSLGETCFALFTADGDAVALSTGIIVHVHTMSEDIKQMIEAGYEEFPGIREGDIYSNNDPALGNVHTTDIHTLVPIFYQGELVGWAGGVTHQVDIGGVTPGHDIVAATSRYEDGLYMTNEKIGEQGKLLPHYLLRSRQGVRTPLYYDLDEKARIAGAEMIKRAVIQFIDEYGLDFYLRLSREVIEFSRRNFLARVKERLVPGRFRATAFVDTPFSKEAWQPQAQRDTLHHLPLEVVVKADGTLRLDFEGNSGYGPWAWNTALASVLGALWVVLSQMLGYSEVVNEGYNLALETYRPPRTWLNNNEVYDLSRQTPWYLTIPIYTGLYRSLQRGFLSRGYVEEGASGYGMTADPTQGGMVLSGATGEPKGVYAPITTFEISAVGMGANATRDGIDHGYAMWNPESDMGDVEEWERLQMGLRYLSRRIKPNSAGYGRRRGGAGFETMGLFYGVAGAQAFSLNQGMVFTNAGNCGGYPAFASYTLHVRKTDIEQLWRNHQPYPQGDDPDSPEVNKLPSAEVTRLPYGTYYPRPFDQGDLIYMKYNGGPGYGDPLERPIELCERDLNDGIYTERIMESVYGIVASRDIHGGFVVDRKKSEAKRAEIRRNRRERSVDFAEFYHRERNRVLNGELTPVVRAMYAELADVGPRWWEEYRAVWQLPEEFTL
ncbi:hydantoinase B/oxoprolinase family protein [Kyrpidia sp.]|nr:hydantoinase B/oxoprolinase family protein [Kyrpidia sp.]MCL6576791.1 hydantoinase B/oxoprolinase family protein [Kyrpidia sp.]